MTDRPEPPLRARPKSAPEAPRRPALRAERKAPQIGWGAPVFRSLLFAVAGAVCLVIGLLEVSGRGALNPTLPRATEAAEDLAVVTTGVYVSLRAINAALSAAQEVEVGASIGAQANLQPLKVLEPVDDTVERVADVVFAVATGAALASVGLQPVSALGLIVLGLGLMGYSIAQGSAARACLRAVRLGAALGLALPLVFAGGVWLGDVATRAQWDAAFAELDAVAEEARVLIGGGAEDVSVEPGDAPDGMLSGLLSAWSDVASGVRDAGEAVSNYLEAATVFTTRADTLLAATLTLIGIFLLRILILPGLLLWAVMALIRKSVA